MKKPEHGLLLIWLMLTGGVVFLAVIAGYEGLLTTLVVTDQSKICVLIGLIYIGATWHSLQRTLYLSNQLNQVAVTEALLTNGLEQPLEIAGNRLCGIDGVELPRCFVSDYVIDLIRSTVTSREHRSDNGAGRSNLLDIYSARIASRHEHGWFIIDVLLKLGLLGTIIGFILMLGSVASTADIDIGTMQKVLKQMSYGMGTALYTTLAGLIGAILLAIQYHLLDRGLDELVEKTAYLTEVHMLPRLAAPGSAHGTGLN